MGKKRITKQNMTPEQWSMILKAVEEQRIEKEEEKIELQLKKYKLQQEIRDANKKSKPDIKGQRKLEDEIFKLMYGMPKKEYLNLKADDTGKIAVKNVDTIDKLDANVRNWQFDESSEILKKEIEKLDDRYFGDAKFRAWAADNLENEEGKIGEDDFRMYNYEDLILEWGEIKFMKKKFIEYLEDSLSNRDSDGYLDRTSIWDQFDLDKFQNDVDYRDSRTNPNINRTGIKIDGIDDFDNESGDFSKILSNLNQNLLNRPILESYIKQIYKAVDNVGISSPEILQTELPKLYEHYEKRAKYRKDSFNNHLFPKLLDNGVDANEIVPVEDANFKLQDEIEEFKFNKKGTTAKPDSTKVGLMKSKFISPKTENLYGSNLPQDLPPDSPPESTIPKDTVASSPAFSKTRRDWTKTTGKKWHETA